jgi:hypothetical protein
VAEAGGDYFMGSKEVSLDELEKLGPSSMATRRREAHPKLTGTENDCIRATRLRLEVALGDGKDEKIKFGAATVLLLFKRK